MPLSLGGDDDGDEGDEVVDEEDGEEDGEEGSSVEFAPVVVITCAACTTTCTGFRCAAKSSQPHRICALHDRSQVVP